jgi:GNAT superfamily N-acetyltransferase
MTASARWARSSRADPARFGRAGVGAGETGRITAAQHGGEVIGYGLAHVMPAAGSWVGDIWQTGERIGGLESLAALPACRGQGIGFRPTDGEAGRR